MIKEGVVIGGRYEILERIGVGGMADVYKAIDRVLRRYVAVKVLKREFREDETFVGKFRSEAQAAAGLTHPNIVNVYDVAEDRGLYYIVMELVEGITLKEYIQKKGRLTPKEVINITLQVCMGIEVAHANHIVHRDIKPQNIMISKEGKVKVTDFGIAKATSSNTISTNAMGSVHYTSPEQARGGFSDTKSDIYSLGITMYEMVTGRLPFDGDTTVAIALKHLQEDIVPPSEYVPDIPYSLEQIILKCTQKSPDRRYPDVTMLIKDLKRSIQDPDGDFVKIPPIVSAGNTVTLTQEEMDHIQGRLGRNMDYDDDEEDDEYYQERKRRREAEGGKNPGIDPKMAKVIKILTIVAAVIFVGLMIGLLIWPFTKFGSGSNVTQTNERNVVPDLIGMTKEEAEKACKKVGLAVEVKDDEQLTLEYDKGYIYKQLTDEGTRMPEGARVKVYISAGLKEIEVPDVAGMTEKNAKKELTDYGFKEKNLTVKKEESKVKAGSVTRTDPAAGEMGTSKTRIVIYISKGLGKTKMPDLVGLTKSAAQDKMNSAGLNMKVEYVDVKDDDMEGKVTAQEKEAGEELDKGTDVKVTVAKLPSLPGNEEFKGKTLEYVKNRLQELGFMNEIDAIERENTDLQSDTDDIVIQVEQAGQSVKKDERIRIYFVPKKKNVPQTPPPTED